MRTCLIILGMHRSGTSALGGVLEELGIRMGKVMLKPTVDNPKGYFENKRVADFNDNRIFPLLQSTWYDIAALPEGWHTADAILPLYEEAKQIIGEDYAGMEIFGIKDPRICILFPFWERVLNELEIAIKIILPYRSPLEVHHSMHKRNDFSMEKSLMLWTKHVLFAEYYSRNHPRVFTTYDTLLHDTKSLLSRVSDTLGIVYPNPIETRQEALNAFLEKGLRHTTETSELLFEVPLFVAEANRLFLAAAEGRGDIDAMLPEFDRARMEYACTSRYMFNADLEKEVGKRIQNALKAQRIGRRLENIFKRLTR